MSNPVWPSTLRKPRRLSWREKPQDRLRRFAPKYGPEITAGAATSVGAVVSFMLDLPLAQLTTFQTFYDTTLKAGALPFDMSHPLSGATLTWKFASPYEFSDGPPGVVAVSVSLMRLP